MNRDGIERDSKQPGGRSGNSLEALKECECCGITHVGVDHRGREFEVRGDRAPGSGADPVAALLRKTPR